MYDVMLFLALLWHRYNLKREGSWWNNGNLKKESVCVCVYERDVDM